MAIKRKLEEIIHILSVKTLLTIQNLESRYYQMGEKAYSWIIILAIRRCILKNWGKKSWERIEGGNFGSSDISSDKVGWALKSYNWLLFKVHVLILIHPIAIFYDGRVRWSRIPCIARYACWLCGGVAIHMVHSPLVRVCAAVVRIAWLSQVNMQLPISFSR